MLILGVICAIFAVIITAVIYCDSGSDSNQSSFLAGFTVALFIVAALLCWTVPVSITPMDVYQGKTILEYKVVDGVRIDSCVMWKKK